MLGLLYETECGITAFSMFLLRVYIYIVTLLRVPLSPDLNYITKRLKNFLNYNW